MYVHDYVHCSYLKTAKLNISKMPKSVPIGIVTIRYNSISRVFACIRHSGPVG